MRLDFYHDMRQFFFVTLALEGRPHALSYLTDVASQPTLLPPGETALAILRATHAIYPCATISNRVIMPDHIHFLLLINYARAPTFSTLWFCFVLIEAIENAWAIAESNARGRCPRTPMTPQEILSTTVKRARQRTAEYYNAIATTRGCGGAALSASTMQGYGNTMQGCRGAALGASTMQGYGNTMQGCGGAALSASTMQGYGNTMQGCEGAALGASTMQGYGNATQGYGGAALSASTMQGYGNTMQGCGGAAPVHSALAIPPSPSVLSFERRPYIELSFDSRQLKAIRRYIKLNPARAIWKRDHPDRFRCYPNVHHPILDSNRQWAAIGNLTLLSSPFLFHVRLTTKLPLLAHQATIAEIVQRARRGEIPVSGFISPGESELLRRLKAEPLARFIKVLPCALPPQYDPSAEDSRELSADRMLLLSGFLDTPHISPYDMKHTANAAHQFRTNCLALNALIADLCNKAHGEYNDET